MINEQILIEPLLTEKTNELREENKYVFKVHPKATKNSVKSAVAELFGVKVSKCTVMNVNGKMKRLRGKAGRTSSWKKAIVRLAPGESIKIFEGA